MGKNSNPFKDMVDYQNNMYNPGHYVGTGRIMPGVSAPGNALPLAIMSFIVAAGFLAFSVALFLTDASVINIRILSSPVPNKVACVIIPFLVSLICSLFGYKYFKKAKGYYKEKKALNNKKRR